MSDTVWIENHSENFFAIFSEISQNNNKGSSLEVVLQRSDGLFIKLTNEDALFSYDENDITISTAKGTWTTGSVKNLKEILKSSLNFF